MLEGAKNGAVVDVEELDGPVVRGGECVLVVGQRHEVVHRFVVHKVAALKVFSTRARVPLRMSPAACTRTVTSLTSFEPLRMRWTVVAPSPPPRVNA